MRRIMQKWLAALLLIACAATGCAAAEYITPVYHQYGLMAAYYAYGSDEYMALVKDRDNRLGRVRNFSGSLDGCNVGEMAEWYWQGGSWDTNTLVRSLLISVVDPYIMDDADFVRLCANMNSYDFELIESELYGWGMDECGAHLREEFYLVRGTNGSEECMFLLALYCEADGGEGVEFAWYSYYDLRTINPGDSDDDYNPGDYSDFGEPMGDMYVVNCREWVSLRAEMNTSSARLAKVPLGAKVTEVYFWTDEFAWCTYNNQTGFIQTRYLSETPPVVNRPYSGGYNEAAVVSGLAGCNLVSGLSGIYLTSCDASSYLVEPERSYPPTNMFDENYDNAWADGVSGEGVGETVWARWNCDGRCWVTGVAIRNGYQKTQSIYDKNSRPRDVVVNVNGTAYSARLMDSRSGWQSILFDRPVVCEGEVQLTLTITSVYPGNRYQDTCITEIDLLLDGVVEQLPGLKFSTNSQKGSVEQDFQKSAFWDIYPDYVPFDGENYASTSYTQGWCEGDYIFTAGCYKYRVVNCDSYVSLRMEANADTAAILQVPKGATVLVSGELNGWMLCLYDGRYGWIKSGYLRRM